jgi:hypothetical protein
VKIHLLLGVIPENQLPKKMTCTEKSMVMSLERLLYLPNQPVQKVQVTTGVASCAATPSGFPAELAWPLETSPVGFPCKYMHKYASRASSRT